MRTIGTTTRRVAYSDIDRIWLWHPSGLGGPRCELRPRTGSKLLIASERRATLGIRLGPSETYVSFVRELIRRTANANRAASFIAGPPWWFANELFTSRPLMVLIVLVPIALLLSIADGASAAQIAILSVLTITAVAGVCLYQRNRARRSFDPAALPPDGLPE